MSRLHHVQSVGVALSFLAETNPVGVQIKIGEGVNKDKGYVVSNNNNYQRILDNYMYAYLFPVHRNDSITEGKFEKIFKLAEQRVWNELAENHPDGENNPQLKNTRSKVLLAREGITMWNIYERLRAAEQRYKRPSRSSGAGSSSQAVETFDIRDHGKPNEDYKIEGPRNPPDGPVSLYQERMDEIIFKMLLKYDDDKITGEQFKKLFDGAERELVTKNDVKRLLQIQKYDGNQSKTYLGGNKEYRVRLETLKQRYLKISEEQ